MRLVTVGLMLSLTSGCGAHRSVDQPTQYARATSVSLGPSVAERMAISKEEERQREVARKQTLEQQRASNYEDYLKWDGYTLGYWDGEGRMENIADTPSVLRRLEQLQRAGASLREVNDLFVCVNRGTLVNVIQRVGDMSEIALKNVPWENSFRVHNGQTGWVFSDSLVTKPQRDANPRPLRESK